MYTVMTETNSQSLGDDIHVRSHEYTFVNIIINPTAGLRKPSPTTPSEIEKKKKIEKEKKTKRHPRGH